MRQRLKRLFWGAVLFAMFGLCVEIAFTGLDAGFAGSFRGHVSLLMIPVYALAFAIAGPVYRFFDRRRWYALTIRVPIVVAIIYAIEWASGAFYARLGLWPWRYEHGWASDFSNGHVTLWWLPAWIAFALALEVVYRMVETVWPHVHAAARRELEVGLPASRSALASLQRALFLRLVGVAHAVLDAARDRGGRGLADVGAPAREQAAEGAVAALGHDLEAHPDPDHDEQDPEDLPHDVRPPVALQQIGRSRGRP